MLNKLKQMMRRETATHPTTDNERLKAAKRNIYGQSIGLAVFVVVVTVILLFAATTAWYTNTITAGGLSFKAEAWGFEGNVTVSDDIIEAAPGDSGIVEIRVKNTGDIASAIGISITKQYMEEVQMQKRIYFYVDKSAVVNGESVDRVYLNNTKGYSYTLYGKNELILSEDIHTDVLIKWEWVYDVVGYYFVGEVDGDGITVDEYLRPVEYSYDKATYDDDGNILTVDGEKDTAAFLAEITAADGYKGAYSGTLDALLYDGEAVTVKAENCYPIDEENNVWVYFCKKSEIDTNTVWDTMYASTPAADKKSYQARITVTGEQLSQEIVVLGADTGLSDAFYENDGNVIRLDQNFTTNAPISVGGVDENGDAVYVNAVLDLNGYDITVTNDKLETLFDVTEGSSLTIYNGTITGPENNSITGVRAIGSAVTLNNVDMNGIDTGVRIDDNKGSGTASTVIISDCTIDTKDISLRVYGNGATTKTGTQIVVQDSTLISRTYIGITGSGNSDSYGTNIQVLNSTVEGYYSAIYHPQSDSRLTLESSVARGITGIAVKGGEVIISNSTVESTVTDSTLALIQEPTDKNISKSGYLDTGDAVYIESNYLKPIKLVIKGDSVLTHVADISKALRVFPEGNHVKVIVTGGTFSTDVSEFLDEDYISTKTEVETGEGDNKTVSTVYTVTAREEAEEQ